jgi:hypothetical protein
MPWCWKQGVRLKVVHLMLRSSSLQIPIHLLPVNENTDKFMKINEMHLLTRCWIVIFAGRWRVQEQLVTSLLSHQPCSKFATTTSTGCVSTACSQLCWQVVNGLLKKPLTTYYKVAELNRLVTSCSKVNILEKMVLRWFISNCSGNENLLKLLRGWSLWYAQSKNRKKSWGHRTRFEDMTSAICQLRLENSRQKFSPTKNSLQIFFLTYFRNVISNPAYSFFITLHCSSTTYIS